VTAGSTGEPRGTVGSGGPRPTLLDLTGRRVVVTGGSRGIGAACCRLFARAGATVCVVYRESDSAAGDVLADARRASDRPHLVFRTDHTRPDQVRRLFDFVAREWGGLDCLVNNAGVWERNPIAELDLERYSRAMDVNVLGPFLCTAAAVPLLERSDDGNVVNLTSTAGQRGEAFHSPYAASKGALISATKAWSTELAPRIRVNSVAPGWVDTDMSAASLAGAGRAEIERTIPRGRVASAEEIAGPVVFLASPLARHVTGEILNVNGGAVLVG
jgi:3-oxoacyl-[acyl-carrier protein] reductase